MNITAVTVMGSRRTDMDHPNKICGMLYSTKYVFNLLYLKIKNWQGIVFLILSWDMDGTTILDDMN